MTVLRLLVDCFDDLKAGALHGLDVLARGQQLGCCIVSFDACPNVHVFPVCAVERIRETPVDDRRFRAGLQQPVLFAERERPVGRVAHGPRTSTGHRKCRRCYSRRVSPGQPVCFMWCSNTAGMVYAA